MVRNGENTMSFRNHSDHKSETKAVKAALRAAGINAKVGHGSGTAWAWLEINIGSGQQFGEHVERWSGHQPCGHCRDIGAMRTKTQEIALQVTGRAGDRGGEILVLTQDHWNQSKKLSEPITHPNWSR